MKSYLFYPGCSMDASAEEYQSAMLAVFKALGAEVREVEDWTCCGASVAPVMSDLLGLALPARNLAIAERMGDSRTMVVGCSACFTSFARTNAAVADPATLARVNQALEVENLSYNGTITVRHMLDVLANDLGPNLIAARKKRDLKGLKVAPYYGCQTVRPYPAYDAPDQPVSMDIVLRALGAEVFPYSLKARCCGGINITTSKDVGIKLVSELLLAAEGADCIATVCPLCQMNLEAYQGDVSRFLGREIKIPVLYLTQLMGLAFDLPPAEIMLEKNISSPQPVLDKVR